MVNYDEWFIREVEKGPAAAERGELHPADWPRALILDISGSSANEVRMNWEGATPRQFVHRLSCPPVAFEQPERDRCG